MGPITGCCRPTAGAAAPWSSSVVPVWLSTGFIAAGEHGPKAQLVAIPPELNTRSIAAAEALEDSLDRSVETLVAQVRTADLEHLAQQLRTTAQGQ